MPRPPDNTHSPAMKTLAGASVGLSASSTDPVRLALPGVGESCALWAVGQLRYPFAKLVLSVPEVVAMLRILGLGGSAIPGRRRCGRRLTNCDLTNSRYCDLSLSVS